MPATHDDVDAEVSVPVLDELIDIRRRQKQLEDFQARAAEMQGKVETEVYRRVLDDYAARHADLARQAAPLKVQARDEYARLRAGYELIERRHRDARLQKEELEFRRTLGELTDAELAERIKAPQQVLDECDAELTRCDRQRARFQQAMTEEELDQAPPAAPAAAAPAPPPPALEAPPPPVAVDEVPPLPPPPTEPPSHDSDATFMGPMDGLPDTGATGAGPALVHDDRTIIAPVEDVTEDATGRSPLVVSAMLLLEEANVPVVEFPLGAINQIGRSEDNQVRLVRPGVSRHHAVIRAENGGFVLQDLNSQNGTFLNGERIHEDVALSEGDRIWVGDVELRFTIVAD